MLQSKATLLGTAPLEAARRIRSRVESKTLARLIVRRTGSAGTHVAFFVASDKAERVTRARQLFGPLAAEADSRRRARVVVVKA